MTGHVDETTIDLQIVVVYGAPEDKDTQLQVRDTCKNMEEERETQ